MSRTSVHSKKDASLHDSSPSHKDSSPSHSSSLNHPHHDEKGSKQSLLAPHHGSSNQPSSSSRPTSTHSPKHSPKHSPNHSPKLSSKSPHDGGDVVQRLTDTEHFPAGHKARFEEVEFERQQSKERVQSAIKKNEPQKDTKPPEKPKVIIVFKNGTKTHEGTSITINQNIKSLKILYQRCPNVDTGPVKKLYDRDLETVVAAVDQLRDGRNYLACGVEPINRKELPVNFQFRPKNDLISFDMARVKRDFPDLKDKEVEKAQKEFSEFDDDGNGKIDRDEIRAVLSLAGFRATEDDIKSWIVEFDKDRSGTIDFYEFLLMVRAAKKGTLSTPLSKLTSKLCVIQ